MKKFLKDIKSLVKQHGVDLDDKNSARISAFLEWFLVFKQRRTRNRQFDYDIITDNNVNFSNFVRNDQILRGESVLHMVLNISNTNLASLADLGTGKKVGGDLDPTFLPVVKDLVKRFNKSLSDRTMEIKFRHTQIFSEPFERVLKKEITPVEFLLKEVEVLDSKLGRLALSGGNIGTLDAQSKYLVELTGFISDIVSTLSKELYFRFLHRLVKDDEFIATRDSYSTTLEKALNKHNLTGVKRFVKGKARVGQYDRIDILEVVDIFLE